MSSNHSATSFSLADNLPPFIHRLSLVDKPLDDIPLLPGESIHLGYMPMTEEQAFEANPAPLVPPQMTLSVSHFRMARDDVEVYELVTLIHRFIAINDAVERLVPKRQYINYEPGKRLYKAKVTHSWRNHHATILVSIIALPASSQEERDEFAIDVRRLHGSVTAHRMFFHTLEQYVQSYGQSYPVIRPVSVDREALANALPPKHVTWQEILNTTQHQSLIDEDEGCQSSGSEEPYQTIPFRDVVGSKTTPGQYSSDEESK